MLAYYKSALSQTFIALERHPALLLLYLDLNYSAVRWNRGRVEAMLDGYGRRCLDDSILISAWQTAGPALDVSGLGA